MSVESEVPNAPISAVEVFYGGCKLVPAPLIDWSISPEFDDTGTRLRNVNSLTLTGTVLILPSGSYEQMYAKQDELKAAFATDYLDFTILAGPGNKTMAEGTVICSGLKPKVNSLNITPDIHVLRFDYSIELEDSITVSGVSGVTSSLSNQWSFSEEQDSCTLKVDHQVSAEGPDGETDKFEQAVRAVKPLLGIANMPIQLPCFTEPNASGNWGFTHPSNPAGGPVYEVSVQRQETADVANGTYSVTESFTIVSGVPFYFTQRNESYDEDQAGVSTVTIAGTIQGLGRTLEPLQPDGGFGFARACSGFIYEVQPLLPTEASGIYSKYKQSATPTGLNVNNPTSLSISQNKCRGTVDFSVSYTDDPTGRVPSGIVSSTCSVSHVEAVRLQSSHVIPFRRLGNIVQDIKTPTEGSISISCQAQSKNTGDRTVDTNRAINHVQDEINRLKTVHASPSSFVTLRITNLTQQESDIDLTATATLEFAFTADLNAVPDVNSDISLRTL